MRTNVSSIVSDAVMANFEKDGVICLRSVIAPSWIELLRGAVADVLAAKPSPTTVRYGADTPDTPAFFSAHRVWPDHPPFVEFERHGPTAELAGRIMRSRKITLYSDHVLVKEPGESAPTPWHHDLPYWSVRGNQVCSVWIPLDDVDAGNGVVQYVRGSHRWDRLFRPAEFGDSDAYQGMGLETAPDIEANRADYDIVSWDTAPGDCLVFSARTLHGGPPNLSSRQRRAVSIRWAGDDATYFLPPHNSVRASNLKSGDPLEADIYPVMWRED